MNTENETPKPPQHEKLADFGGLDAPTCSSSFKVGDRVTLVKSPSLPESMVGKKAIIQGVDLHTDEDQMKYHVIYRMDGKTPIRMGTDTLADEYLDRSNLRLGWD